MKQMKGSIYMLVTIRWSKHSTPVCRFRNETHTQAALLHTVMR